MSVLSKLRYGLARMMFKGSDLAFVPQWVRTSFLEPTFDRLTQEGYAANAAVFACISTLAFSYVEPDMIVVEKKTGQRLPDHPLQQLLARPNDLMGGKEMGLYQMIYKAVGGQAYIKKVRNGAGVPIQLWPYHVGHISPVPGTFDWIAGFEYSSGGGKKEPVAREDIVHIKWPSVDLRQPWMAMPVLRALARETDTDNEAGRYIFAVLFNDAIPRTALTVPAGVTLTDPQFERLRVQFSQRHGGDNRGNVAVVEGGAKIERIGLDLEELAFEALRRVPEARIAAGFRVPAIIAGLNAGLERSTYSNFGEARQHYTESTLVPQWELDADELTNSLAAEFSDKIRVVPDLDKVKALQEQTDKKYSRVIAAFDKGLLLKNEARRQLGLDDLEEAAAEKPPIFAYHIQSGIVTINEVRASLGLPPLPGGDTIATVATAPEPETAPPPSPPKTRQKGRQLKTGTRQIERRIERAIKKYLAGQYSEAAKQIAALSDDIDADALTLDLGDELIKVMQRFYPSAINAAYDDSRKAFSLDVVFDLENERVQDVLGELANAIKGVTNTTRDEVRQLVGKQAQQGWSNQQLAEEIRAHSEIATPKRALTIARTETGIAYNRGSLLSYADADIEMVEVLDGDDDEACASANGQIWTLKKAAENPLEHPHCERAFAPIVK